jgi:hypothetical protein
MPAGISAIVPLATTTLANSSAYTVTFSSIASGYRDYMIVINGTTTSSSQIGIRFNGDTGNNYYTTSADGTGNAVQAYNIQQSLAYVSCLSALFDTNRASAIIHVLDATATDKHKTVLLRGGNPNQRVTMNVARWTNTAAVSSFTLNSLNYQWATGTTMSLYGVTS